MNIVDNFRNGIKAHITYLIDRGYPENIEDIKKYRKFKLIFLSDVIFGVITYDTSLSIEFGKEILDVMEVIHNGNNFEYIKDKENYKKFIRVANILDNYNWIEWGSSIRGCWFNSYSNHIIDEHLGGYNMKPISFDDKSICELIKYLKSEEL